MEQPSTIRKAISSYISSNSITLNKFAELTGIHSRTLSRIMKGGQALAMSHLERVTVCMGLPEDHFFTDYVDECLHEFAPTWRRIRPFMQRCAELDRLDCIENLVQGLLDNVNYQPLLFELAEELYQNDLLPAATVIYENVALSEKLQHSERLALCKYRLFTIAVGDDKEKNLIAAALFEPYAAYLDEYSRLDAMLSLIHVHMSLHHWDKVDELAQDLLRLSAFLYDMQHASNRRRSNAVGVNKGPSKPLYRFMLYAHLIRSLVQEEKGDYSSALDLVQLYTNVSWVREQDEEANRIVKQFQEWGEANAYLYRLLDGQREVVEDYVEYISTKENEIPIALYKIVETANRFHWNIDDILERFADYISYKEFHSLYDKRSKQVYDDQYSHFQNELAKYYLTHKNIQPEDVSLCGVDLSATFDNERNVIKGTLSVEFEVDF